MKKEKCAICFKSKGKRICMIKDDLLICPKCCAEIRTFECEGCDYYEQAEKYSKEKEMNRVKKTDKFTFVIDPIVDEAVDKALEMAEKGKLITAKNSLLKLMYEHSENHSVQYGMGIINILEDKSDEALQYFERAVAINPLFTEAWYNKGSIHQKKLEITEMIRAFQKVMELGDPSDDFVKTAEKMIKKTEREILKENGLGLNEYIKFMEIFNKSFEAMEKKQWRKAISGYKQIIAKSPKHVQSYGNMGICYGFLNLKKQAIDAFDKALKIDPDYEPAKINREIVISLKDGEKPPDNKAVSVNYYRDMYYKDKAQKKN